MPFEKCSPSFNLCILCSAATWTDWLKNWNVSSDSFRIWRPFKRQKTDAFLRRIGHLFSISDRCDTILQRRDKYRRSVHHPPSYPVFLHQTLCWGYYRTNLPSSFTLRAGVTIGQIVHPLPLPPLGLCLPPHHVDMPPHLVVFRF